MKRDLSRHNIKNIIYLFLEKIFTEKDIYISEVTDNTLIIDEGYLDSLSVIELITFIEEQFSIDILESDFDVENLSSIEKIVDSIYKMIKKE